jgi:hypothetical protein
MEKNDSHPLTTPPQFTLGKIVWTRAINNLIAENTEFAKIVIKSLKRHSRCDWGDLCEYDNAVNDRALSQHLRIISAYKVSIEGVEENRIWIITEADRSATTVLFPHEY